MRSAAPVLPAPWSGCASRTSRRNRRCTSSRSMAMPGVEAEDLHGPAALGRDARPLVVRTAADGGRRTGAGRTRPGEAFVAAADVQALGQHPRSRHRGVDEPERHRPARRRQPRRGHERTDHLGRRGAVEVELEDRPHRAPLHRRADDPVAGEVEAVGVGLQPVAQGDARDRDPPAGHLDQAVEGVELLLVEPGDVLGDDGADEHPAERRTAGGEVPVVDRHPTRRHVPARVADVQLGEQHVRGPPPGSSAPDADGMRILDGVDDGVEGRAGRIAAVTSSSSGR